MSWTNKRAPNIVYFISYVPLHFLMQSALHCIQSSQTFLSKTHCLSILVSLYMLCNFILQLLNIQQPNVPKELVCFNMKIWPHLAEVMGNKHLTRGWADRASNSNFLSAPCWFAVLPGSAHFPHPHHHPSSLWSVFRQKKVKSILFPCLCLALVSSIQIYWYWPFAEIKHVDPWAVSAKFKPIKEHFTNQQVKARAVSQAGPVKLESFALYQTVFAGAAPSK